MKQGIGGKKRVGDEKGDEGGEEEEEEEEEEVCQG